MASQHFDYIVVGAGSAGCVLANRLTEDGTARVLLIEAGGRDVNPLIQIPLGMGKMHEYLMHDWGYGTEPEPGLNDRRVEAMRGKVLGGSSSINVMAFTRGNRNDYNRWVQEGATGWSYAEVLPYFKRAETWEGGENTWRGGSGPVGVQFARTTDPLYKAWIEAGKASGFPHTEDYNGRDQVGFGRSQYSIRDGRRSSAARAYLRPARRRPNLTIAVRAHATRVILENGRARGVEYVQGTQTQRALADRDIVLSGGTFNTPQLLMLSGIGPADHLKEVGIETLVDLPVGTNLQDHLAVWIMWARRNGGPFREQMRFDRMALNMVRAYMLGTGPGTVLPGGLHGFVKTRPDLDTPDIEFMFRGVPAKTHLWFAPFIPAYADGYGIRPTLLHPRSRGRVLLRSADPRDKPRIVYNFFSDPADLPTLREGFKRAREVGYQSAMDEFRGEEVSPGPKVSTDAEIEAWIRKVTITAHHASGSCRMGTGPESVLGPDLKVKGVEGLRVADASVMPSMVSAHTNAAAIMIGEKASDLVLGRQLPPIANA